MVNLTLYRDCPWPRDYSEVVELYGSYRGGYLIKYNRDIKDIHHIPIPGWVEFPDMNIPTGALNFTVVVNVDPSVGNHFTYAQVADKQFNHYWYYWIDSIEFVKKRFDLVDSEGRITHTMDLLSISCTIDIWAQYGDTLLLHDSYVERKTVKRWILDEEMETAYPKFYTSQEHCVGSYTTNHDCKPIKEYVDVYNQSGQLVYPASSNKAWLEWAAVYATHKQSAVIGLGVSLVLAPYGEYDLESIDHYEIIFVRGDSEKAILPTSVLVNGDIYSVLKLGSDNSTLVNCELIPFVGVAKNCIVKLKNNTQATLEFDFMMGVIDFQTYQSPRYWLLNARLFIIEDIYTTMHFSPFMFPGPPTRQRGEKYSERHEPMLYQSPARVYGIVNTAGALMGTFSDYAVHSFFKNGRLAIDVLFDFSATTTIITPTDRDEYTLHPTTTISNTGIIGRSVSVPGYKGIVAYDNAEVYRNSQYNADLQLKESSELRSVLQTGLSVAFGAAAAVGGTVVGGPVGTAAGIGVGLMAGKAAADALFGYSATEKEWEHKQTLIANQPNDILFSGGIILPYKKSMLYAIVEKKLDPIAYEGLQYQLYYKGIRINSMIRGPVDLHERVGFDYIQCSMSRVYVPAPSNIQIALQELFNKGIRIYHDLNFFEQMMHNRTLNNLLENFEYYPKPELLESGNHDT